MRQENGRESQGRVVHVTTVHNPHDPRIFQKQLFSLREAGYDTHLIAPHEGGGQEKGAMIHALPERKTRGGRLALQPELFQVAHALDADVYQIHDPELIPLAYLLKQVTGAAIVYDMHENYRSKGPVFGRGIRRVERWCFGWIDHVLLAEESYQSIVEGTPAAFTCILNYVRAGGKSRMEPMPPSSSPPTRLLYTGTVAEERGLRTMLDVATAVQQRGRPERLDIVGICHQSDQRRRAEDRIRRKQLEGIVNRVGWDAYVPPSEMEPYYQRADVGLALCEPHPNLIQSLLTKFYEYLYYGLPIVCSDFPLWREFVEENECGVVVPAGDREAVLRVLDRWRERPNLYRQYVKNARTAASKYQWEQMGQRLVDVYRGLLLS